MVGATNRLRAQEEIGGESHKSRYGDTWIHGTYGTIGTCSDCVMCPLVVTLLPEVLIFITLFSAPL